MKSITPDTIVIKPSNIAWQVYDGEAVLLDLQARSLQGLNSIGSRIWELIEGEQPLREIAKVIATEYHREEQEVFNDIKVFVEKLIEKKLLTLAEP